MTYNLQENSREQGQPIELYDFVLGGIKYSVCTCADPVMYTVDSVLTTYTPLEIHRDRVVLGPEDQSTLLEITMPSAHALPQKFVNSAPGVLCSVTIRRVHKTDTANELVVAYKGILRSVMFSNQAGVAKIGLMSQMGAMSRNIPRYTFQSLCNNVLFDRWCTISSSSFNFSATVSAASGSTITVPGLGTAKGNQWAQGGYVSCDGDYRLILDQTGDVLTILLPFVDPATGLTAIVYAGCDHSLPTCRAKFNNVVNFNGFAFIPTNNPFTDGIT